MDPKLHVSLISIFGGFKIYSSIFFCLLVSTPTNLHVEPLHNNYLLHHGSFVPPTTTLFFILILLFNIQCCMLGWFYASRILENGNVRFVG